MPPAAFAAAPATSRGNGGGSSSASVRSFSSTRQQARGGGGQSSANGNSSSGSGPTSTGGGVIAPRAHRPRVLTPSHLSQEKPYFSDTTGPLHHSLRGSKLVLFPKATSEASTGGAGDGGGDGSGSSSASAAPHLSNPNERVTRPHQFQHAPIRAPPEWAGDRSSVMRTSAQADYPSRDAAQARAIPMAGCGGRVATAQSHSGEWVARPSDLSTAPTPLQSLAASRHTDLLHAARLLQAKAAAAQQAADRLFETSARERYEVVREKNAVQPVNLTSPFFLGKLGASARIGAPQTHRERRAAPTPNIGAIVRPSSASSAAAGSKQRQAAAATAAAGLGRERIRDWASDPSLRLVARADAERSHDDFGRTFARIVSADPSHGGPTRDALSTTAESLRAGRAQPSSSDQAFVPHFLRKIHPSLHGNIRRNVFANGNEFIDPLGSSSKFQTARFVPRAYNSDAIKGTNAATTTMTTTATAAETAVPATTQQPSQVAQPAAPSQTSGGS